MSDRNKIKPFFLSLWPCAAKSPRTFPVNVQTFLFVLGEDKHPLTSSHRRLRPSAVHHQVIQKWRNHGGLWSGLLQSAPTLTDTTNTWGSRYDSCELQTDALTLCERQEVYRIVNWGIHFFSPELNTHPSGCETAPLHTELQYVIILWSTVCTWRIWYILYNILIYIL